MVTGHVPFEGDTAFTIGVKHKSERPRNPRELNAQLPEDLSRVILKCLEKDKGKRYQTAEELRAELEKIEQGLPTTERLAPKRKSITSKEITVTFSARKLVVPAIALILVIAGSIMLWRIIHPKPTPSISASGQPSLAVLYFENKSGDVKLDYLREELAELINIDLSQSRFIRVVTGEEMYTVLKRLGLADSRKYSSEDIEKIATQTRATHVLRGSFIKAGESFVITAGLQKPGAGESSTPLRIEAGNEKDIIVKVDELTRQVKEGLNLTAAQISGDIEKEAGKIMTSSPEALRYYLEGRRHYEKNLPNEYKQSIAYMEKAVEIDPEFAMAYRSLAGAHGNLGNIVELRKNLKKAIALSDRIPEYERLFIEGSIFHYDEDYAKAIKVLENLAKAYPGYLIGRGLLAISYASAGDLDKAIKEGEFYVQNLRTARTLRNLGSWYTASGQYQKAENLCQSFLRDVEENAMVRYDLIFCYLCQRQFDLALDEAQKVYLLEPSWKDYIGLVLLCKDDFAGAERILGKDALLLIHGKLEENVNLGRKNLDKSKGQKENEANAYGGLSWALEAAGRYEEAYRAFAQYLKLSAEYRKSAGESGLPYLPSQQKSDLWGKGIIQAEMKSFDEAQKTAEELKSLIAKGINKKELRFYEFILGLVELGKKNPRKAADFFSKACSRLDFEGEDGLDKATYFNGLSRALYESGDLDKAREAYEKITLLTTGRLGHDDIYVRAYYMLGKIAEQQGDKPRARENYRKFLDLWKDADPGLPEVADAKLRLARLGV
jgi:tetratricopeptide (TPR) repeat protein